MVKIVIVGGGSTGWFTAAWLAKKNIFNSITTREWKQATFNGF